MRSPSILLLLCPIGGLGRAFAALVCAGLLLGGCAAEKQPEGDEPSPSSDTVSQSTVPDDSIIQATGTVRYVDLEGGFYGLVDEAGTKYDPRTLPERLRVDGLSVRFRVVEEDVMTTRMWGSPVKVLSIERVEDENE